MESSYTTKAQLRSSLQRVANKIESAEDKIDVLSGVANGITARIEAAEDDISSLQTQVDGMEIPTLENLVALPGGGAMTVPEGLGPGPYTIGLTEEGEASGACQCGVNLLDNWYFADPINQRGSEEYTANGYTIDRWINETDNGTVAVNDGFVSFSWNRQSESVFAGFVQYIEAVRVHVGRANTLSVLASGDGVIEIRSADIDGFYTLILSDIPTLYSFTIPSLHLGNNGYVKFRFISDGSSNSLNGYINLFAAKMELGDQQTLAHQDSSGNWVLNDPPPNKALELLKCQRYQYATSTYFAPGIVAIDGIHIGVNFPWTMGAAPTMKDTPDIVAQLAGVGGGGFFENMTASYKWGSNTSCVISFSNPDTSKFPIDTPVAIRIDTSLLFDANI